MLDLIEIDIKEFEKYRIIQDKKYVFSMDEFYKKYLEQNNKN